MAQIPRGRFVKGPYKPICRDCAIYFSLTVLTSMGPTLWSSNGRKLCEHLDPVSEKRGEKLASMTACHDSLGFFNTYCFFGGWNLCFCFCIKKEGFHDFFSVYLGNWYEKNIRDISWYCWQKRNPAQVEGTRISSFSSKFLLYITLGWCFLFWAK